MTLFFDRCLFSWGANKHMVAYSCGASFPAPAQLSTEKRCDGKLAGPGNEARLAVIHLSLEVLSLLTFLKLEYTCTTSNRSIVSNPRPPTEKRLNP